MSFKIFEKMQATSLYWFAAQQQNRTLIPQRLACFTLKLMQNLANLVFFLKATRSGQKWQNKSSAEKR